MTETVPIDLTVVIVNWNTGPLLAKCVASVYATITQHSFEVVLVDNNSTNGGVDSINSHSNLHLIRNSTNLGFAKANNQGLALGRGRYVLLLNPDTKVLPEAIDRMIEYMDSHPRVGALGPRLLNEDLSVQPSCAHFPTLRNMAMGALGVSRMFPRSPLLSRPLMTYWTYDYERDVDQVSGACLMIRRAALDEVGVLDERFYVYYEEVDLCFRLKQAGWIVRFIPTAQAIHVGGQSSRQSLDVRIVTRYRSLLAFYNKHFPPSYYFLLRFLIVFEMVWRIAVLPMLNRGLTSSTERIESFHRFIEIVKLALGPKVVSSVPQFE